MRMVCLFVPNKGQGFKNRLHTKSTRRTGVIDNKYPRDHERGYPKPHEHWLVDIIRENRSVQPEGGCFIMRPIQKAETQDLVPLVHGMYTLKMVEDTLIITPYDQTKFWVLSAPAKIAMQQASPQARAVVINLGGNMWAQRRPVESILEVEARRLMAD